MIVEGVRELDPGFLAWDELGPYVAGAVILGAALYQLSPLKDSCLRQCRSPAMLLQHWRPGPVGALRMGFEHGGFCIGCCWALMAALFAVGVMSVGWMAFIAALIAAEKLLPWRAIANRGIAVAARGARDRGLSGGSTPVSFTVTSTPASAATDRFYVVFRQGNGTAGYDH